MRTDVEHHQPPVVDWTHTDLYRFFAFAFGSPNEERQSWFAQPGVGDALAELWDANSHGDEFPSFEWFEGFEPYEAAYIALFDVGAPEPPVPLLESAHDKSRTPQELALENTYFYEVLGLRVDPSQTVPDHLVTQLEFLSAVAFAREHSADNVQRRDMARLEHDFLQRHLLNWVGVAEEKLRASPFIAFRVLFALMTQELKRRHELSAS